MPLGLQTDGHPPWTATVLVGGGWAQPGPLHVPSPAVCPLPHLGRLLPDPFPAQEPCGQDPAPPHWLGAAGREASCLGLACAVGVLNPHNH